MALRIFITTDNHVGYNEDDLVRGPDAINAFNEAMEIAAEHGVDMVLQGGDLFHTNRPSKQSLYEVMHTLRRTCLSDKPVEFDVLNHGPLSLKSAPDLNHVNFKDPNFNIGIPVFCISGNHDDAGGNIQLMSPLDVLSMSGLVNHFGRVPDSADITVTPVIIAKGDIKVALYGLASVRDERLFRTFRENKVKFLRPKLEPENYYSILVVHQNHARHGPTNYLPEEFIPNFFDLVIWGHEHECRIDPVLNNVKQFYVMQPGSTVQTSLSESETIPKRCAIVSIGKEKAFSYETFALKTARPFAFGNVVLDADERLLELKPTANDTRAKITQFLIGEVEKLITEAKKQYASTHSKDTTTTADTTPLPLIRLRVDYTGGYEVENVVRFSKRFEGKVANSNDILHYFQRRQSKRFLPKHMSTVESTAGISKQVGDLIVDNLKKENLQVLVETDMVDALKSFVEKDDKSAIKDKIAFNLTRKIEQLVVRHKNEDDNDDGVVVMSESKNKETNKAQLDSESAPLFVEDLPDAIPQSSSSEFEPEPVPLKPPPKRTRSTRARATRTTRAAASAAKSTRRKATPKASADSTQTVLDESNEPEELQEHDDEGGMFG